MDKIRHDLFCTSQQFDAFGKCLRCSLIEAVRRDERNKLIFDVELMSYHKGRRDSVRAAIEFLAYNEVENFGRWWDDLLDYIEYKQYIDLDSERIFDELDQ